MSSILTVDLGNSRCKLRIFEVRAPTVPLLVATHDEASAPGIGRAIEAWLAKTTPFERAALSSVGEPAIEEEIARVLGDGLVRGLESGLSILCREPARVGLDRLFAARGACELVGGSAIVLDAGTALTVDAVRVDADGAGTATRGRFLGGAIAPGPALLADALALRTARLPRIVPAPGAHALGRDTREALQAGTVVGFRGAARELVASVAREAGLDEAPLVVTGGAREFLRDEGERTLFGSRRVLVEPELVSLGLLAALLEHGGQELVPRGR